MNCLPEKWNVFNNTAKQSKRQNGSLIDWQMSNGLHWKEPLSWIRVEGKCSNNNVDH